MNELNAMLLVLVSAFGGLGASVRYLVSHWAMRAFTSGTSRMSFPWWLWSVNISGSFVAGVITGHFLDHAFPAWAIVAVTGFLGGYTTFSAASYDTVSLLREGRIVAALSNAFGQLFFAVIAAFIGIMAGMSLG